MTSAGSNKKKPLSPLTVSEKLELIESRRQKQMKKSEPKTIKVNVFSEVPKNYTGIAEYPDGDKIWYLNGKRHREDGPAIEYPNGDKIWYLNNKYCSESEWKELLKQMEKSTLKIYESIFEDASFKQELKEKHNAEVRKQVHDGFVVYSYHDIDSGKLKNISLGRGDFKCGIIRDNKVEIDTESASTISFYKDSGLPCAFLMADEETGKFVTEWKGENSSWFYDDKTSWENGEWSKINFHKTTGAVVGQLPKEVKDFINNLDVSNSRERLCKKTETKQNTLEEINIWSLKDVPAGFTGIANFSDGSKHWFLNGKWHREDGPACEVSDGRKLWYLNGERHREDGPAVENADGYKEWWLNGHEYSESEWKVAVEKLKSLEVENKETVMENKTQTEEEVLEPAILKVKTEEQIPDDYVGIVEFPDGEKQWRKGMIIHREDGPAIEWANGTKEWVVNGECHRVDGPAIEYSDGSNEWYLNGKRHRVGGPAVDKLYGPIKKWYLNGVFHREDGPAIEKGNKYKAWYLNGVKYSKKQWLVELEKLKKEREKPTLESLKDKFKDNSTPLGEVFNDFIYDRYFDISISEDGKRVIVADKQCHEVSEFYSYAEYSTADGSLIEGRYYSSKGERLTLADNLRALQAFREETIGIEGFKEKVLRYHGFKDGEYRIHNSSFVAKDKIINVYWIQKDKINYIFTVYNNKGKLIHEKVYGRSKTNLEILDSSLREDVISFKTWGYISNNEWRTAHFSADGKYHSLTGPAVIRHGSRSKGEQNEIYHCEYAINGVFMPKEVWFERAYDLTKDKQGLSFEEWKAKIEPTLPVVNVKEQALAVIEKPKVDTSTFAAVKKTIKSDAREVAKRIAVKRIIKFAAEFIANQFKSQKAAFKSIEEFLRSDRGTILLQLTAGTLLPQFKSSFPEKYHALYEEVCNELRIQAEVGLADELIDVLVPAIKEQIHLVSFHNSSSEDIKVRVDSSVVETSLLETEEKKNLPEEAGQPFAEDLSVSRLEPLASDRA